MLNSEQNKKWKSNALASALKWTWLRYLLPSRENERCPWCFISCLLRRFSQKHAKCEVHDALCHPGVTRLYHFVRSKNLPYSMNDVEKLVESCRVCSAVKPQLYRPPLAHLVKATQPFERLSIDFKGPLPSNSPQRCLLTVVTKIRVFLSPFLALMSMHSLWSCVWRNCLCCFVYRPMFGMPAYIHSDRGFVSLSQELITFLHECGVACSRTSAYNAPGNGQCGRYNGII